MKQTSLLLTALAMVGSATTAQAQNFDIGLQLGEFDAVTVRANGWQADIGIDTFGVGVSRVWNLKDIASDVQNDLFYLRLGGRYMDSDNHQFGIDGAFGAQTRWKGVQFYGEVAPTVWVIDDFDTSVGVNIGFRFGL